MCRHHVHSYLTLPLTQPRFEIYVNELTRRSWEFGVERVCHVTRVYIIVRGAVSCRQCANPEDHVSLKLIRNKSYLPSLTKDHRSFMLIQYQSYPFSQTKDHRSFRLIRYKSYLFQSYFLTPGF